MRPRLDETLSWEDLAERTINKTEIKNPLFRQWFMQKKGVGGFFFSALLYGRCFHIWRQVTQQDKDHFVCITGVEGTGKSTLGLQMACVIDPNFSIAQVCYEPVHFVRAIKEVKPGSCILLDEGCLFLFSREAMSDSNRLVVKLLTIMRQKNLVVIVCLPNFHILDTYLRDHRVQTLIHINKRGCFTVYVGRAIKILSKEGRRYKVIEGIKTPYGLFFQGNFNKKFPETNGLTRELYIEHKSKTFQIFLEDIERDLSKRAGDTEFLNLTQAKKVIPVSRNTLVKLIREGKVAGKQVGAKWYVSRKSLTEIKGFG